MKMNSFILFFVLLILACTKEKEEKPQPPVSDYKQFGSLSELEQTILQLISLPDSLARVQRMNALWDSLKTNRQIPFAVGDSVMFFYKGQVNTVLWAGDFNSWNPNTSGWAGQRIGQSDVFQVKRTFPSDSRLDYKLVINNNWVLDPANSYVQYSGFGPNSELRMPDWVFPKETVRTEGVNRGTLGANQLIHSSSGYLGYQVQYKVYLPYGYETLNNIPVIYVTDGHEYADDRLGAMVIVLDNLIHQRKIKPLIAVFVDPRNPSNLSQNRRMDEYRANIRFAGFLAEELVPQIDADYKTNPSVNSRAILGTSLGGWNSAFTGIRHPETFGLIGIHSPAFDQAILQEYNSQPQVQLKIFMSTGLINDTQNQARAMRDIMQAKGYPLKYIEVNEGHSWGNWRALIEEPLVYFFPPE
jgi:enterochelin esterase family protein